jgi:hypothetical protein
MNMVFHDFVLLLMRSFEIKSNGHKVKSDLEFWEGLETCVDYL